MKYAGVFFCFCFCFFFFFGGGGWEKRANQSGKRGESERERLINRQVSSYEKLKGRERINLKWSNVILSIVTKEVGPLIPCLLILERCETSVQLGHR